MLGPFSIFELLRYLTLYKLHHEEIVGDGLLTIDLEQKNWSISLQTEANNFMCNWQSTDKNLFDRCSLKYAADEKLEADVINNGITTDDFYELIRIRSFNVTMFATNPRQTIDWLENIAPKTHGIVNVSCEIENQTVSHFNQLLANLATLSNTNGTVDWTVTFSDILMPGVGFINAKQNKFAYETTTTRFDCDWPETDSALTSYSTIMKLYEEAFWRRMLYISYRMRYSHISPESILGEPNIIYADCSIGRPTTKNADFVEDGNLKYQLHKKEIEEQRRQQNGW